MTTWGHCLCGAVRFEYDGVEKWRAHCHCESCRRATSSPITSFLGVPLASFRFTGDKPAVYESSPGVRRRFCGRCGSPVAYESDRWPDEIHLYAASLEHPEDYRAQAHVNFSEHLPWFDTADELPRLPRTGSSPQ